MQHQVSRKSDAYNKYKVSDIEASMDMIDLAKVDVATIKSFKKANAKETETK